MIHVLCSNFTRRVIKGGLQSVLRRPCACLSEEAPYYSRNFVLLVPLLVLYLTLPKNGAAPVADDQGPKFPTKTLNTPLILAPYPMWAGHDDALSPHQNHKYESES